MLSDVLSSLLIPLSPPYSPGSSTVLGSSAWAVNSFLMAIGPLCLPPQEMGQSSHILEDVSLHGKRKIVVLHSSSWAIHSSYFGEGGSQSHNTFPREKMPMSMSMSAIRKRH